MLDFRDFEKLSRQEKMQELEAQCTWLKDYYGLDNNIVENSVELENIKRDIIYCQHESDYINLLIDLVYLIYKIYIKEYKK